MNGVCSIKSATGYDSGALSVVSYIVLKLILRYYREEHAANVYGTKLYKFATNKIKAKTNSYGNSICCDWCCDA